MTTIAGIIAARAAEDPHRVALRAPGCDDLTYRELQAVVAGTRASLRRAGIGARDRVAVVLPNGAEMARVFLGVSAGAVCAPLNPAYTESELAFAFADLGIKAVVAGGSPAAVAVAQRLGLPRLGLDPNADAEPADEAPGPDDIALVLHTSGTTARPKIVPLTHRNLCASAANVARALALSPDDSCLNLMPLFHIHGLVAALLASVTAGASLTCTPGFSGADLLDWLGRFPPTWYSAVPTIHQAVLDACAGHGTVAPRLRLIRSSSAPLPQHLLHELAARFGVPVIEAYGMTEAAHQMATNPLGAGRQKPGSVGLPAGPEIAVMDDAGALLPAGGVGEFVIRGETVTRGYEANPEANAAAFRHGWFRTGDQGYIDAEGYLFLTGRLKELINRGGEKIAPHEVEEALLRHPDVTRAVAYAVPHPRLGEEVGAAVVLRPGSEVAAAELRRAAAAHLAYFKLPRQIEIVDAIPTGATGKVQRTRLAEMLGRGGAAYEAPRTPLEERMAAEWARLLGVASVGLHDDFFALGGDSLAATEMIEAMAEILGSDLPIADFLENPTIAGVSELGERARATAASRLGGLIQIRLGRSGTPVFCTPAHDGSLWRVSLLVRHLKTARPILGFPATRLDATGPLPTIESLAAEYVRLLQQIQPEGPVHLVGPCFGGAVALEMASQFQRLGRPVALLVMINCFNRAWRSDATKTAHLGIVLRHLLDRVRFQGRSLRRFSRREGFNYVRTRLGLALDHWREEAAHLSFELATRTGLPRPKALQDIALANVRAQKRYTPTPYSGEVLMVRAEVPIAGVYPLPRMGWAQALPGAVEMLDLPCEQLAFWNREDLLRQAAARIDALLERR